LILPIVRTALLALRRDRAAFALSFVLPIAFFSIFAAIFGSHRDTVPSIKVIVVDRDQSAASRQLVSALEREGSLKVYTHSAPKTNEPPPADYTAATAEEEVKSGNVSVALIIPHGFGDHPISFRPQSDSSDSSQPVPAIELLNDASDTIAPQMVAGLLQKTAMTAMPSVMAEEGMKLSGENLGGFTPDQQKRINDMLAKIRQHQNDPAAAQNAPSGFSGGIIAVKNRAVVGENKNNPMVSFYAAGIGVMFLLFTASGAAGALLDEAESGALDRVLSSRVTMTSLLAGKLVYNTLLAFTQLTVMFLWAWAVFKLDLFTPWHVAGFLVMGLSSALAVASFGLLLASICRTRAQLGALSTLVILMMSSIGGSMFPRFLMSESMQKAGLFTINAWAIDGFTKVFWRDLPVSELWPQVGVLLGIAIALFLIARRIARRWEYA
jgi:ABC-2 type transport system permease protein